MLQVLPEYKREMLLRSPVFQVMRPVELDEVLAFAAQRRYRAGEIIFRRGDEGSFMVAVLMGRVRIGAVSSEGKEITLNIIREGEVFGEIALLDGKPRTADAVALTDCTLLTIERRNFLPYLKANDDLTIRLLAMLCERLRRTSLALEEIALLDIPARLARLLLKLGEHHGRSSPHGLRIDLKLSQRDLSTLVATTRETVNKQLRAWEEDGLLENERGYVVIRRPDALAALIQ
jgi:CRP-like cAMP-binding protein